MFRLRLSPRLERCQQILKGSLAGSFKLEKTSIVPNPGLSIMNMQKIIESLEFRDFGFKGPILLFQLCDPDPKGTFTLCRRCFFLFQIHRITGNIVSVNKLRYIWGVLGSCFGRSRR